MLYDLLQFGCKLRGQSAGGPIGFDDGQHRRGDLRLLGGGRGNALASLFGPHAPRQKLFERRPKVVHTFF